MITAASIIKNLHSTIRAACRNTTASLESSSPPVRRFAFQRSVVKALLLSFYALTFLFLCITHASAKTWYIKADGTGDAPTIQAGVDSAAAGDTVLVAPGEYSDTTHVLIGSSLNAVNVHLYKNIKLIAEGSPENTTIGWEGSDIGVCARNVNHTAEIVGFKITTGSGGIACVLSERDPAQNIGTAVVCRFASPRIAGNEIFDNDFSFNLENSSPTIEGNSIHYCPGILEATDSSPNIILNNIYDACWGMRFGTGCAPFILGNDIHDIDITFYGVGIECISGATAIIEENCISEMATGIKIVGNDPPSAIIRGNLINLCEAAVDIHSSSSAIVENNTIEGYGEGWVGNFGCICRGSNGNNVFRNNIIIRCGTGINGSSACATLIECNALFEIQEGQRYIGMPDQTGLNGNIFVDPEFCGISGSGNYYLQSDSPCAPGNHPDGYDCGLIGAYDVRCTVPITEKSWGLLKAIYRGSEKTSTSPEKE